MKRFISLLLLLLTACCQLYAGDRTEKQMKDIAANALSAKTRRAASVVELKEFLSLSKLKVFGYENGGFAVVPSDDRYESVIGISASIFDGPLPCGFKWWIESVNEVMEKGESKGYAQIEKSVIKKSPEGISPLLSSIWGQERPFNDYCTFSNGNSNYQCVTGCVATALAQVMNYYHFPISGTGTNSYNVTYNNSFTITFSEDFSQSVYDWGNILDDYSAYNNTATIDAHTKAVAKLMKDCGVATNTRFSDSTHGSSSSAYYALNALTTYFKYDKNITKSYDRSKYEREEWLNIIYEELDKGRPIFYTGKEGESITSNGHAFVINGYDADGRVYVNWGWDGRYNGYYDIDLLNPYNYQYNYNQSMIVTAPGTDDTILQTVTISSSGSGCVGYEGDGGTLIRNKTQSFKIKDGGNLVLLLTPDIGCSIKSVKVNGADVTSSVSNNQYEVSNIQTTTTIDVEFDEVTSYSTSEYNKYITCGSTSLSIIQVGSMVKITLNFEITNSGNSSVFIKKVVAKNPDTNDVIFTLTDTEINGELQGNSVKNYSMELSQNLSKYPYYELEYTWENKDYTYFSSQNCILIIQADKLGNIIFADISVGVSAKKFSIESGGQATIEIVPNAECELWKLTVNNSDVTEDISNNKYTIMNITSNTSVKAAFDIKSDDNPAIDGHKYVDLGLSSGKCWSIVNYGAEKPEDAGSYGRNTGSDYVKNKWGDNWRMPTKDEFQELIDECEWNWTERNGMNGFDIKGKNGKTMFLPAAGYHYVLGKTEYGMSAYYLTSTTTNNGIYPWILKATSSSKQMIVSSSSIENYTIRPILNKIIDPPFYKLSYIVDGEVYKTYELKSGETITPEPAPMKEGYSFSGWSEIPENMPAHDVTVTGSFTINKYKLVYQVDGEVYRSYEIEYGAAITPEPVPTKEEYTFSGWSNIPETMPAHDVTVTGSFTINKYKLTYKVDGEVYKSFEIEHGATITPEPAPIKEGYTFSGWSWIPNKMPAEDVTVTGSFTINMYKLTYMVDNEVYKSYEIEYGATITPEPAPTKEGYSFTGWSWIPNKMPAEDVIVTGSFSINKYKLTYIVDGEVYKSYNIEYGASITPETEPTKEGFTFSGWSWIPTKMPAEDVSVSGYFNVNQYTITYIIDNEVYMTEKVDYGSTITPPTPPSREGYDFAWGDYPETMPAYDITIYGTYTTGVNAIWAGENSNAKIYSINGKQLEKPQKGLNIIRMSDGTTKKVVVK